MSHHKINEKANTFLEPNAEMFRLKISCIYILWLRLLRCNVPREPFVEAVISALPFYLNLTDMNFLDGKHLVEVSRILFLSDESKLHDVLAQTTKIFNFILSNS
jgi:hypothetical protein